MRICQVELRNFRGIRQGTVALPNHALVLGANNAGESTITEALALLFARERTVRPISPMEDTPSFFLCSRILHSFRGWSYR